MNAIPTLVLTLAVAWFGQADPAPTPQDGEPVTVKLLGGCVPTPAQPEPPFTARITAQDLILLIEAQRLPGQFELKGYRNATAGALEQVSMEAVIERLSDYLADEFADRFNADRDLIVVPVPEEKQVTIETPDLTPPTYRGPKTEVIGLLLHEVTETEFTVASLHFIQKARQLFDSHDPVFDRTDPKYYQALAQREIDARRAEIERQRQQQLEQARIRAEVAESLGLKETAAGEYTGDPEWLKESRRFSYIVKEGKFIQRLQPLVEELNYKMEVSGFAPESGLDKPGIYYDPEIGDVEILLPKPMLTSFLGYADQFERRMAEDAVISIEAVRLTDRDIISGAVASRVRAQVQGVHNVRRFNEMAIFRELGLNSLLAVANQQLQVRTLRGVAAGDLPEGVGAVQVASPTLPPIDVTRSATTLGSTFAIGADPLFFDGREETYGLSYIGPDGHRHTLSLDVVDSLRETWSRIERNLIVHKIKKTDTLTPFSVPVGPDTKTYQGIAALISQENQQLVVATGTGAISEISATAGTWLIIEDFEITPIPGSSTTLTEEDKQEVESRVLLTMFLRDPQVDSAFKRKLLSTTARQPLRQLLRERFSEWRHRQIRGGRNGRTYGVVYDDRSELAIEERRYVKREHNSVITLTFYSSQGNIIQTPGSTQLGDANDLTSFTTLLRPNIVTPISSFFTKSGSGTLGSAPLRGTDKGEQTDEEKTMTHLVIRARFPTTQRENKDRDEGRFTGYFALPINREPSSDTDLPFLSSSEHPAERLAKLRVGLMFENLDYRNVRKAFARWNPNRFPGTVPRDVWESDITRMLMMRKIVSDSPGADEAMASEYGARFVTEVRSLLEYDEDFFDAPNSALSNMTHWNNPDRIARALNNSPGRFALERLIEMLDELGKILLPDAYVENYLAFSPPSGWSARRIYPLADDQIVQLRRDVAAHYLRFRNLYGDAFLEAVSAILGLGTYRSQDMDVLMAGPFRGYLDLVLFDAGGAELASPTMYEKAHKNFLFLKEGGYRGKLFEPSMLALKHLPDPHRALIYRGPDIIKIAERAEVTEPG